MKKKLFLTFAAMISLFAIILGCSNQEKANKVIKIGYQKGNTLNILKARGTLEKRLKEKGYTVEWTHFPMGSVLLEALNAGSIQFGHSSDGNSVFAQASGKPLVYLASESPYPKGVAIVVPENSPIKTVKDLKGKRVAVSKGGNQQYLLVKALEKEGLKFEDVIPVYYKDASEARAIFDSGNLDALGLWDPYLAVLEEDVKTRTIVTGEGLTDNRTYYFASESFSKNKEIVQIILEELEKSNQWSNQHPKEVAKILSKELGISEKAVEVATKRRTYGIQKIDQPVIQVQQELADTFYQLKLIPKKVDIGKTIEQNPTWLPSNIK